MVKEFIMVVRGKVVRVPVGVKNATATKQTHATVNLTKLLETLEHVVNDVTTRQKLSDVYERLADVAAEKCCIDEAFQSTLFSVDANHLNAKVSQLRDQPAVQQLRKEVRQLQIGVNNAIARKPCDVRQRSHQLQQLATLWTAVLAASYLAAADAPGPASDILALF